MPRTAKAYVTVHIYGHSPSARYYTIKYRGKRLGGQFQTEKDYKLYLKLKGIEEAL